MTNPLHLYATTTLDALPAVMYYWFEGARYYSCAYVWRNNQRMTLHRWEHGQCWCQVEVAARQRPRNDTEFPWLKREENQHG